MKKPAFQFVWGRGPDFTTTRGLNVVAFVPKVKIKDDGKGNVTFNKVKLRLVFDGQFMEKDYDYSSSFSPVVKMVDGELMIVWTYVDD